MVKFRDDTYLKFIGEKEAKGNFINFKASTVQGYIQIWNKNLKPHFGEMTLREYRTHHGSLFLTQLAKTYRALHTEEHQESRLGPVHSRNQRWQN